MSFLAEYGEAAEDAEEHRKEMQKEMRRNRPQRVSRSRRRR